MAKTFIGNIGGSILPSGSGYTDVPTQKDATLFDEEGYDVNGVYVERSKGMFIKNSSGGNLFDALSMGVRFHFNNEPEYASWVRRSVIEDREILDELEKFCNSGKYNFVRFYPSISVTGDGNCDVYYNFLVNNQHFGLYVGTIHENKDAFTIEGCVLFIGGVTEAKEPTDELLGLLWTEWAENATQTSHAGKADKATIADNARIVCELTKELNFAEGGESTYFHPATYGYLCLGLYKIEIVSCSDELVADTIAAAFDFGEYTESSIVAPGGMLPENPLHFPLNPKIMVTRKNTRSGAQPITIKAKGWFLKCIDDITDRYTNLLDGIFQ